MLSPVENLLEIGLGLFLEASKGKVHLRTGHEGPVGGADV